MKRNANNYQTRFLLIISLVLIITWGCGKEEEEIPSTYTLSISVSPEGTGTVNGAGTYKSGYIINISATPNEGYDFLNWTQEDVVVGTDPDFDFNMPAEDVTLAANFMIEDGTQGNVTDIDGNVYNTVFIGEAEWMAENLKTSRYNDGKVIPNITVFEDWSNLSSGAYAWFDNDQDYGDAYGALYNWYAVETGNLCPDGWRVPTDEDWSELSDHLVEKYDDIDVMNVGKILKSCRQVDSPMGGDCNTSEHPRWNEVQGYYGTDDFGFSALPGGRRGSIGTFSDIGRHSNWWSASEHSDTHATNRRIILNNDQLLSYDTDKNVGFSVRCIRE